MHAIQISTKTQNCFSSSLCIFYYNFVLQSVPTQEMLVSSLLKSALIVHRFTRFSASIALSLIFCVKKKIKCYFSFTKEKNDMLSK